MGNKRKITPEDLAELKKLGCVINPPFFSAKANSWFYDIDASDVRKKNLERVYEILFKESQP